MLTTLLHKFLAAYTPQILSFSQEGEDKIISRIFEGKKDGFFVDVGAHHPFRFSNTYRFYLQGWSGVNIDAMPGSMEIFRKIRPRDINIEAAISDKEHLLNYYAFNDPALNGFSKEISEERDNKGDFKIIFQREIKTQRLDSLLEQHLKDNTPIDFLSIDVEGLDLNVLKSNNWQKFRPKVILVEVTGFNLHDLQNDEVVAFLEQNNYEFFAKTYYTVFFVDKEN